MISKTQIALEYAYRRCDEDADCSVFWVHADNQATLTADYKTIGEKLGVSVDDEAMLKEVRNRIEARPPWVMIIDNADDLELFIEDGQTNTTFHRFLPQDFGGSILWTTRDGSIAGTLVGPRQSISVRTMTNDEAVLLLVRLRNDSSITDAAGLDALLEELEYLPLAVSQATVFMRNTSMSIKDYLGLLSRSKSRWDVLKKSNYDRHRRPVVSNSILETWRISIQRIQEESEMSYRILHAIAFLGSQDIPHELVVAASREIVGPTPSDDDKEARARLSKIIDQELDLEVNEAISRLQKFSLLSMVRENGARRGYDMHKLVQEAVRYGLAMEENSEGNRGEAYFAKVAVHIVWSTFPMWKPELRALGDQYLPHARHIARWAELSGMRLKLAAVTDNVLTSLLYSGRLGEMEAAAQLSLNLRQETLGDHDKRTLGSKYELANVYHHQRLYKKAEIILRELVGTSQQVLGYEDSVTLNSKVLLAGTYAQQRQCEEAEPLAAETLAILQQKCEEDGLDLVEAKSVLAYIYEQQSRWEEADLLRLEGLKTSQRQLGEEHYNTLSCARALIRNRISQRQWEEVVPEVRALLQVHQRVLGEDDPATLDCMGCLAKTHSGQKKWESAEALQRGILETKQRVFGEHPGTTDTMQELADIYCRQGQYKKAEPLQRQVLEIRQRLLGEEHSGTLTAMRDLAWTYYEQGRYDSAEILHSQGLEIRRRVLGDEHSWTQSAMNDLAKIYSQQGRFHRRKDSGNLSATFNGVQLATHTLIQSRPRSVSLMLEAI
jgi:tetratricopeptide (TPR) repeat protein